MSTLHLAVWSLAYDSSCQKLTQYHFVIVLFPCRRRFSVYFSIGTTQEEGVVESVERKYHFGLDSLASTRSYSENTLRRCTLGFDMLTLIAFTSIASHRIRSLPDIIS